MLENGRGFQNTYNDKRIKFGILQKQTMTLTGKWEGPIPDFHHHDLVFWIANLTVAKECKPCSGNRKLAMILHKTNPGL